MDVEATVGILALGAVLEALPDAFGCAALWLLGPPLGRDATGLEPGVSCASLRSVGGALACNHAGHDFIPALPEPHRLSDPNPANHPALPS